MRPTSVPALPQKRRRVSLGRFEYQTRDLWEHGFTSQGSRTILFDEKVESKLDHGVVEFKHQKGETIRCIKIKLSGAKVEDKIIETSNVREQSKREKKRDSTFQEGSIVIGVRRSRRSSSKWARASWVRTRGNRCAELCWHVPLLRVL